MSTATSDSYRLAKPIRKKETYIAKDSKYVVGTASMQGWRPEMEDAHTTLLTLPDDPHGMAYFGVFDGHGGGEVSKEVSEKLHYYITRQDVYKEGRIELALHRAFLELDDMLRSEDKYDSVGCAATVILIKDDFLWCANAGDCRAVLSLTGKMPRHLSFDHKPTMKIERNRILAAGGRVEHGRVNGSLDLSRGFGDFKYKKNPKKRPEEQLVIAVPDIIRYEITKDWEFIVIACDGIWQGNDADDVIKYLRSRFSYASHLQKKDDEEPKYGPDRICADLINHYLAPDHNRASGYDNITATIICFLHGKSYKEMCKRCR